MSLYFYPQCWTSLCHLFKFKGIKDLKLCPCPPDKFRDQGQYYLTLSPYGAVILTYNFYENPFLRPGMHLYTFRLYILFTLNADTHPRFCSCPINPFSKHLSKDTILTLINRLSSISL